MPPEANDALITASIAASQLDATAPVDEERSKKTHRRLKHSRKGASKAGYNADLVKLQVNWDCTLMECLPADLMPRPLGINGKRNGVNMAERARLKPHQWPKRLAQALAMLSTQTVLDREYAIDMLAAQVAQRQQERVHPEWYAREVLVSDVAAVGAELAHQYEKGTYEAKTSEWSSLEVEDMKFEAEFDVNGLGTWAEEGNAMREWNAQHSSVHERHDGAATDSDDDGQVGEESNVGAMPDDILERRTFVTARTHQE